MEVLNCMLLIFAGIGVVCILSRIFNVIGLCGEAIEKTEEIDRHGDVLRDISRRLHRLEMDHERTRSHVHSLISNEENKDEQVCDTN